MEGFDEVVVVGLGAGRATGIKEVAVQGKKKGKEDSESTKDGGVFVFQLKPSATSVASYKDGSTVRNGLTTVGNRASPGGNFAGDHIAAVQRSVANESGSGRHCVKFWAWKKEQAQLTSTAPEKLGPLCSSGCGSFVVAGGASGKAYLWETFNGNLLRVWKAHYLAVSKVVFLDDDSCLITAGDDGQIKVWNLGDLADATISSPKARMALSDHTLAVTDIWVGRFGLNARLISCSLDHHVKLWRLQRTEEEDSGEILPPMLKSFALPVTLNCCIADSLETFCFVGGADGNIYECPLRDGLREEQPSYMEGPGSDQLGKKRKRASGPYTKMLEGHRAGVTCLGINSLNLMLVSGSLDGTCRIWDTSSGISIKVINIHGGIRPVVALKVVPMPRELAHGHGAKLTSLRAMEKGVAATPLKPLNRYQSNSNTGNQDQAKIVTESSLVRLRPIAIGEPSNVKPNLLQQAVAYEGTSDVPNESQGGDFISFERIPAQRHAETLPRYRKGGSSLDTEDNSELLSKVDKLERESKRWKQINTKLYSIAVDKFLSRFPE